MKKFATLTALLSLATAVPSFAQVEGSPSTIDYQGRVLDLNSAPIAPGTAQNIEMYFRVWNHISDRNPANLIWAEKQIVTVLDGNFSIRLGEGSSIEAGAGDNVLTAGVNDPRPDLKAAFNQKDRFMGISVAANSASKPTSEIAPRLAFLASPFSLVAEQAKLADLATKATLADFASAGPSGGTFTADNLSVGTTEGEGWTNANGIIGFPGTGVRNGQLAFYPSEGPGTFAFIDSSTTEAEVDNGSLSSTSFSNFQAGDATLNSLSVKGSTTIDDSTFHVDSVNNRIGIGTNAPAQDFHLHNGTANGPDLLLTSGVTGTTSTDGFALGLDVNAHCFLWNFENRDLQFGTRNTERMRITSNGDVGIGTSAPGGDLHVKRPDTEVASIYATGNSQGAGVFYAGQATNYGGGFGYDGSGGHGLSGEADRISFFRRDNGTNTEVFSYPYNDSTVLFTGESDPITDIHKGVISLAGGGTQRLNLNPREIQGWHSDGVPGILDLNGNGGIVFIGSPGHNVTVRGTFVNFSDRNLKDDFASVDKDAVLEGLLDLPLSTWKYKASKDRRHFGPMAQDFHAAFDELLNLQSDDTTIAPLDEAGVAFASIQALHGIVAEKDQKIADLEDRLAKIEAGMKQLTEAVQQTPPTTTK